MNTQPQRFLALDVFRGMTICFMIIVNTPGGPVAYSPLQHAKWNGFTPTDLVYPSFMFAVGNAISFVMVKWAGMAQSQVLWKIMKRTFLIFLIGYLMYWFPFFNMDEDEGFSFAPISHTRILGVLQRIALAYGIASLMIYYLKPRMVVIITALLLLLYWALMAWFGDPKDPFGMTTNLGYYIDKLILGENHMYHGEGIAFEPEGFLSTLPSIGNVVAGWLVGRFLQRKGVSYESLTRLLLAGFALITIAYFWDLVFPINKKLWTSSFVLYTVGLDCTILSAIMYVTDFLKKTKWTRFFTIMGKNPLFIYIVSEIGVTILYLIPVGDDQSLFHWLYEKIFIHAGIYFGSLLFAVSWMLICWSVGYFLDKRKIYVRV